MTQTNRRALLGLLGSAALGACVPAAPAIVTRDDPFEGGIGGTGIVGVLTDFGSLRINGLRVELEDSTRFVDPFGTVAAEAAQPGTTLTVFATRNRDRLVARRVSLDHALIGTVAANSRVNGVRVRVEPGAIGGLARGARVAVSGIWTPGGVVASRIDRVGPGPDLIAGVLSTGDTPNIGGAPLQLTTVLPGSGTYLAARGRWNGQTFVATQSWSGRFVTGTGPLAQLSVEGYLEPIATAPDFRIAGLGHSFARDLRLAPLAAERAIYFGRYDGTFRASAGYVVPEVFDARRQVLRDGFEDFPGAIVPTRR